MSRPVRTIQAYYEDGGLFPVDRARSARVFAAAAAMISHYTGRVEVEAPRALHLRINDNPVQLGHVSLAGTHTALHTSRYVNPKECGEAGDFLAGAVTLRTRDTATDVTLKSKSLIHVSPLDLDPTDGPAIVQTLREFAYAFGYRARSCRARCVMNGEVLIKPGVRNPVLKSNRPFCDPCGNTLAEAGLRERT